MQGVPSVSGRNIVRSACWSLTRSALAATRSSRSTFHSASPIRLTTSSPSSRTSPQVSVPDEMSMTTSRRRHAASSNEVFTWKTALASKSRADPAYTLTYRRPSSFGAEREPQATRISETPLQRLVIRLPHQRLSTVRLRYSRVVQPALAGKTQDHRHVGRGLVHHPLPVKAEVISCRHGRCRMASVFDRGVAPP